MNADTIIVSHEEVTRYEAQEARASAPAIRSPRSPIPRAARIALWCLVPVLPVLCVVAVVLRVAFRGQAPHVRQGWLAFLCTLLLVSGLVMSLGTVVLFSVAPGPVFTARGLAELD